ncbi:MAG: hypothetical protein QM503_07965 [Bacteroidota bacterium]
MKNRKRYHKEHSSKKVKVIRWINIWLIVFMFAVVIHDSFVHELPFYYILFLIGGLVIGRFVAATQKFSVNEDAEILTIEGSPLAIIITLILLVIRFFAGKLILEEFNIVWVADALYLLFIGIYYANIKRIIREIDERVYSKLFENK